MHNRPIENRMLKVRMPREVDLLMQALQLHGADASGLGELNDETWPRLLEFADRAHLTLALAQLRVPFVPPWVRVRLDKNLRDNAERFARVRATYDEAAAALDKAGVPFLVLKGFTQAPDYVRDPRLRMQSDLDFYTPAERIRDAQSALQAIGYDALAPRECVHADHVPALVLLHDWQWSGNMYDPAMPLGIDLHYCFWNEEITSIRIDGVDAFWSRRVSRCLGDMTFLTLHPVDHCGYLALHILRNVFKGDSVVHLLRELAGFLDRKIADSEFWESWQRLHSPRMRSCEAIAFRLAELWFSCRLPAAVHEEIESLPASQQNWLKQCGYSPLEQIFRRNKDGRLLQFLIAESMQGRIVALRRTFFPPQFPRLGSPSVSRIRPAGGILLIPRYLWYLGDRMAINVAAILRFLANGIKLGLSSAHPLKQYRTHREPFTQVRFRQDETSCIPKSTRRSDRGQEEAAT